MFRSRIRRSVASLILAALLGGVACRVETELNETEAPIAEAAGSGPEGAENGAATPKAPTAPPRVSGGGHDLTPPSAAEIDRRAAELDPLARRVLREQGTERAFTSELLEEKRAGTFVCKLCGLPLFASDTKFKSGTGWPSYFRPIDPDHVVEHRDTSHGMVRREVVCGRCESHLGHVFADAPQTPTGQRYCINGVAMEFLPADAEIPPRSRPLDTNDR